MLNPSEISDILKQQLENVNSKVKFEEVGTVLSVGDGVAHVYGLENVKANELLEFENLMARLRRKMRRQRSRLPAP